MKNGPFDLSRRGIVRVPFAEIPATTAWLVLSNNLIRQIPREIEGLAKIERLAINDNSIAEISDGFAALSRLSWVDMTRNNLKTLPANLVFPRLVGLGLSENEFEEVPDCIFSFTALRKFGFFANRIRFVSPKIQNLQSLVKLDLSNNVLESLPDELCALRSLTWLNVSNNRLKALPARLGDLVNLEELGLGNNNLASLPCLDAMTRLRVLSAFNNEIATFAAGAGALRKVDLSNNRIARFPNSLLKIPNLHTLSLKNNLVARISVKKVQKSNLRSIDLRFNKIDAIPLKFLRSIERCQALLLDGNDFAVKKDFFPAVPSLQSICLSRYANSAAGACEIGPRNVCDCCARVFVNAPIKMYFLASLEPHEKFCLEEDVCSSACYLNSIKIKSARDAFCNRI